MLLTTSQLSTRAATEVHGAQHVRAGDGEEEGRPPMGGAHRYGVGALSSSGERALRCAGWLGGAVETAREIAAAVAVDVRVVATRKDAHRSTWTSDTQVNRRMSISAGGGDATKTDLYLPTVGGPVESTNRWPDSGSADFTQGPCRSPTVRRTPPPIERAHFRAPLVCAPSTTD